MSGNGGSPINIDFQVNTKNLFRQETFTDLHIGEIQKLTPVTPEGKDDPGREPVFIGNTQLTTPHGPVPIQTKLEAATLEQAIADFPQAMETETKKVVAHFKKMEEERKKAQDSNIIIPGVQ